MNWLNIPIPIYYQLPAVKVNDSFLHNQWLKINIVV